MKSKETSKPQAGETGIENRALRPVASAHASGLEETLAWQIKAAGLPVPAREYRFDNTRRWRLDFAWPEYRIGIEVEGGLWAFGRHQRQDGYRADIQKYNTLSLRRWILIRTTAEQIKSGEALSWIETAFAIAAMSDNAGPLAG